MIHEQAEAQVNKQHTKQSPTQNQANTYTDSKKDACTRWDEPTENNFIQNMWPTYSLEKNPLKYHDEEKL